MTQSLGAESIVLNSSSIPRWKVSGGDSARRSTVPGLHLASSCSLLAKRLFLPPVFPVPLSDLEESSFSPRDFLIVFIIQSSN